MRKFIVISIVLLMLAGFAITSSATVANETQSKLPLEEVVSITAAIPMPLDGTWVILDENMTAPAFFSGGPWTWDSDLPVVFTITDLYVVTDIFKVYDEGSFVIETPYLPDWDVLGIPDPYDDPPWKSDPDDALAGGYFSSAVIYFASGSHSITIEDIHIPPTLAGPPFPDGTVAFKAERLTEWPIDIKPGSDPNSINLKSKGVVPVAILGSAIFDVTTVDVTTLEFGPDSATTAHDLTDPMVYADHLQDVNGDGFMDLVCHFKTQEAGLVKGDTDATLTGETNDEEEFTGMDSVNIVK